MKNIQIEFDPKAEMSKDILVIDGLRPISDLNPVQGAIEYEETSKLLLEDDDKDETSLEEISKKIYDVSADSQEAARRAFYAGAILAAIHKLWGISRIAELSDGIDQGLQTVGELADAKLKALKQTEEYNTQPHVRLAIIILFSAYIFVSMDDDYAFPRLMAGIGVKA